MKELFKQCKIQYEDNSIEVAWILSHLAKKDKYIKVGDEKTLLKPCKVLKVANNIELSRDAVDVNRKAKLNSINVENRSKLL